MDSLLYWVWLSLSCTPGYTTFDKLIAEFDSPERIFSATDAEIASCIGDRVRDYTILVRRDLEGAKEVLDFCTRHKVGILTYSDPAFPESLRGIVGSPVLLYYRGQLPRFSEICPIAVVGSRKMSPYGQKSAFTIAADLARAGATVVSGMAKGIDAMAMAGALSEQGRVIAFLGSGIDVCYPEEHLTLARETVKAGCIMTEYAPGTPPDRYNFPKRNRLISGLSAATLVIEGKEQSGAMITARHAMAQNRPVYALPGNVDSPGSAAAHLLLRSGAKLLTSADDVVRDLEDSYLGILNPFAMAASEVAEMEPVLRRLSLAGSAEKEKGKEKGFFASRIFKKNPPAKSEKEPRDEEFPIEADESKTDALLSSMDPEARMVFDAIPKSGSCALESLCNDALPLRTVMKYLLKLEIKGLVTMLPGERVQRAEHV